MEFIPSEIQVMLLWRLMFTGEEPKLSEMKPRLKPNPDRRELEEAGFIELEKRGRATHVVLSEKAWAWATANLDAKFSYRSSSCAPTLAAILQKLKYYMGGRGIGLAEIASLQNGVGETPVPGRQNDAPVYDRIKKAYLESSGGRFGRRVRLVDLRTRLPELSRDEFDCEIIELQKNGVLVLYTLDNPNERTAADEAAAIAVAGRKRHIVYWEG